MFPAVVLYAVSAVYFAGVMVRLMLTLTPVVCILSAITFSSTLDNYLNEKEGATLVEPQVKKIAPAKTDHDTHKRRKKEKEREKDKDLSDMVCFQHQMQMQIGFSSVFHSLCCVIYFSLLHSNSTRRPLQRMKFPARRKTKTRCLALI